MNKKLFLIDCEVHNTIRDDHLKLYYHANFSQPWLSFICNVDSFDKYKRMKSSLKEASIRVLDKGVFDLGTNGSTWAAFDFF